ncbi:phosphoribosyltransferase [Vibrio agarivorans]|uniref:Phosphoribosyltransferase family protein n=1 Tax=Vibrio agarivorans TaxID=153622 RepID=A0ABT7Y3V5_9VIBR|nr:phosphoribosyltransferase family protein [Vibrio agarivorans]MDN2482645.1 phosphoribosyltransferase family protein [Vibrio agarivorans]
MKSAHIGELVLSEQQIQQGVEIVADKLNSQFSEAVIITVVPGGILFTADLVRKLNFAIKMDYISCPHTPGDSQNQSAIVFHENIALEGKDVIMIDDAIESGGTMKRLVAHIQENYEVKSLSIATLFVKPSRVDIPVRQNYAYEMDNDDLLVGYGLPWQDELRNVPYVSKLVK